MTGRHYQSSPIDMPEPMATTRYSPNEMRRQVGSPRPKPSRDAKDTMCRNVLIYGHCRFQDQGCAFNHDQTKNSSSAQSQFQGQAQAESAGKKTFSADSPSFTPASQVQPGKKTSFSSQAASAAPFTPRGPGAVLSGQQPNAEAPVFNPGAIKEFTPQNAQNYDLASNSASNGIHQDTALYSDPFSTMGSMTQSITSAAGQFNPYSNEHTSMPGSGAAYFQQHGPFSGSLQPPNYHLYAPADSYREDLQPWQRATYDYFLPAKVREDMYKKQHATLQVMPNSALPQLERWFSLFPLDTNNRKNSTLFGYASWLYRATNGRNGRVYCLRRLENYRLTNENALLSVMRDWKKVRNASVVSVHEIFTSREFGDSSLLFAYDYHPLSKTLQEHHFPQGQGRFRGAPAVPEDILWGYICQITNGLKAIHSAGLAARCLDLTKIILTDKGRIRLSACAILDVTQYESNRPAQELQEEDLVKFGQVMLALGTSTLPTHLGSMAAAVETVGARYSANLKEAVAWLVQTPAPGEPKTIDNFIGGIATQMTAAFDSALLDSDGRAAELSKELANGRIARLSMKLSMINERGDFAGTKEWSETGDRYMLKLFRDSVFHQVDADGKPVLSMGHMVSCFMKLDAASEERMVLTSRDNETVFVTTYRELKQMFDRSFNELVKHSSHGVPGA